MEKKKQSLDLALPSWELNKIILLDCVIEQFVRQSNGGDPERWSGDCENKYKHSTSKGFVVVVFGPLLA